MNEQELGKFLYEKLGKNYLDIRLVLRERHTRNDERDADFVNIRLITGGDSDGYFCDTSIEVSNQKE